MFELNTMGKTHNDPIFPEFKLMVYVRRAFFVNPDSIVY